MQKAICDILDIINGPLSIVLLVALAASGLWFTIRTRGMQLRMIPEMLRLLLHRPEGEKQRESISPVMAFLVSLGARVGTGNLAGVATAIAIGGAGSVFWMWVMALLGGVNAFVENTLAQLYKTRTRSTYIGGPAYYITKGLKSKWFAYVFAIAMIADFGMANNMLQSNTIAAAFNTAFDLDGRVMAVLLTSITLFILFGGIRRIARVSSIIVPFMAIAYILLTLVILAIHWRQVPECFALIVREAFDWRAAAGGGLGTAIIIGFKRGLFSNEAGLGSSPNAAATAECKHPATQGLIQAFGIYTDTIIICTCTALIILCSGLYGTNLDGIALTQAALCAHIGPMGKYVIAGLIFFFAFSSIIANSYYGEVNARFIGLPIKLYRSLVAILVLIGALTTIDVAWGFVDLAQSVMALCNIVALLLLGKHALACLDDYLVQRRAGVKDPVYHAPQDIEGTECWQEKPHEPWD